MRLYGRLLTIGTCIVVAMVQPPAVLVLAILGYYGARITHHGITTYRKDRHEALAPPRVAREAGHANHQVV